MIMRHHYIRVDVVGLDTVRLPSFKTNELEMSL